MCEKKKDNLIWWKLGGIAMLILMSCTIAYSCGCRTGKTEAQEERIEQEEQAAQKPSETNGQEQYWQSSSSGVIHNSSCQWYRKSAGKLVDKDAKGRDCKVCGGR